MKRQEAARQIRPIRDRILDRFQEAAEERPKRQDAVDAAFPPSPYGRKEPGWVVFERDKMHEAVTRERAKLGKGSLAIKEIVKVEQLCVGHTDYAEKYALYCAELVLQEELTPDVNG